MPLKPAYVRIFCGKATSMEKKIFLFFFLLLILFLTTEAHAQIKTPGASFTLATTQDVELDKRVKVLRTYLESHNSPLSKNAETFVKSADKFNLDYRLVVAISGVESTFGKQIPENSFNAWGWGIYDENIIRFKSFDDAINTISKGIREQYMDKWGTKDISDIGRIYAESPAWATRVQYFMNKIHQYELNDPKLALSLSL